MSAKNKTEVKKVLGLIGIYIVIYIVCTAMFVALFHTPVLANMKVLMYRGIGLLIITGIIAAVAMAVIKKFWKFITVRDIIMVFVIFCCVNMVIFTLIPVTVERSVSVFMLSYMDENSDQKFTKDDIGEVFTAKYVNDYGAFDKRFDEQLVTGTIVDNGDGTYTITDEGRFIVTMFRGVSKLFNTDQRLVYPNEN
ncbi:MAG: hypothetical protein J5778_05420 [Clostridiales bacterium]|nr:hypothetical protein [Clostridiales bacterium]